MFVRTWLAEFDHWTATSVVVAHEVRFAHAAAFAAADFIRARITLWIGAHALAIVEHCAARAVGLVVDALRPYAARSARALLYRRNRIAVRPVGLVALPRIGVIDAIRRARALAAPRHGPSIGANFRALVLLTAGRRDVSRRIGGVIRADAVRGGARVRERQFGRIRRFATAVVGECRLDFERQDLVLHGFDVRVFASVVRAAAGAGERARERNALRRCAKGFGKFQRTLVGIGSGVCHRHGVSALPIAPQLNARAFDGFLDFLVGRIAKHVEHAAAIDPPEPKRPGDRVAGVVGGIEIWCRTRNRNRQLHLVRHAAPQGFDIGCLDVDYRRNCDRAASRNVDGRNAVAGIIGRSADTIPARPDMERLRGCRNLLVELDDADDGGNVLVGDGDVVRAAQQIAGFVAQARTCAGRGLRHFEVR